MKNSKADEIEILQAPTLPPDSAIEESFAEPADDDKSPSDETDVPEDEE